MSANTTSLTAAIKETYQKPVQEAVWYNNRLFSLKDSLGRSLFPIEQSPGGTAYKWIVHRAANSSVATFSEGDADPAAGDQRYAQPSLAYTYLKGLAQITGHVRDALKSQWFDALDAEMELLRQGLADLATVTSLTDATVGLLGGIDDNNTYAGLARGSITYWESAVTSSVSSIALADYLDLHEEMRNAEPGSLVTHWMMAPNQVSNYAALIDTANTTTHDVGLSGGRGFDLGYNPNGMGIMGAPIIEMPDLTNTVALGLNASPGNFALVIHRPFQVDFRGMSGDSDIYACTMAYALPVKNPIKQGKLEGITA